jgi:hypothetical protein
MIVYLFKKSIKLADESRSREFIAAGAPRSPILPDSNMTVKIPMRSKEETQMKFFSSITLALLCALTSSGWGGRRHGGHQ